MAAKIHNKQTKEIKKANFPEAVESKSAMIQFLQQFEETGFNNVCGFINYLLSVYPALILFFEYQKFDNLPKILCVCAKF